MLTLSSRSFSYCGNSLTNGASLTNFSPNAAMSCAGDVSYTACGGPSALSVFYDSSKLDSSLNFLASIVASVSSAAVAQATAILASGFKTLTTPNSLVAEGANGRALVGAFKEDLTGMTPEVWCVLPDVFRPRNLSY